MPPLILASSSPRRRQLLTDAGYNFTVMPPSDAAEDAAGQGEGAEELVRRLALQKARDVALRCETGIIIGCDTVAECGGEILGKPIDRADAKRMLAMLAGQEHRVFSGLCLWRRPGDEHRVEIEVTRLLMHPIPESKLEMHLDSGDWEGKAGAFGFQDGLDWVHILSGSESNVVGLPMELLARLLKEMN